MGSRIVLPNFSDSSFFKLPKFTELCQNTKPYDLSFQRNVVYVALLYNIIVVRNEEDNKVFLDMEVFEVDAMIPMLCGLDTMEKRKADIDVKNK